VSTVATVSSRLARTPFLVAFGAAALAAGLARALTTSYLPVLLDQIDDEPGMIGTVMLVNAGAGMIVPLVVGLWSDRLARAGRGRRLPFVAGGALLTAGGLVAVALGETTSYLVLAVAGAVVYTGLNALTTAHRALVPELFPPDARARATSAQELSMLIGGLLGLLLGGLLTEVNSWAPFALAAVLVPVLTLPTLRRTREPAVAAPNDRSSRPVGYYFRAAARPGVRGFLVAQILWVLGYAALPAFFLLYAEHELSLRPSVASVLLAGFGVITGATIFAAGRVRDPRLHRPLLLAGVVLMGAGFLGVSATTSLAPIVPALLAAAVGFGLVSTLGFPLFSTLIPEGEAGGYTALYFSVRSISSTIALPVAGWTVESTDSYRAMFVLGGAAALVAVVPLVGITVVRPTRVRAAAALLALVPVLGLLVAQTRAARVDEELFRAVNGLGPGPEALWTLLDPHTRNYLLLMGLAVGAAAVARRALLPVFMRVMLAAFLAWGLLEAIYTVYERPRPEEVVPAAEISLNEHTWARLNSFPSGHMAITAALAVAIALAFPRLRTALCAYVAAVAFTRVLFGAHFPLDVVAGTALGTGSALVVALALERFGRRTAETSEPVSATLPSTRLEPDAVLAIMPSHDDVPDRRLVADVLRHVGGLVIVDDGSRPHVAAQLDEIARDAGAELVRMPRRSGKGSAVRAGLDRLLARAVPPQAVLVIDADGQHPADAIPAFLAEAQTAELVIGDRFSDLAAMPWQRRLANRASRRLLQLATGHAVRDTQNGMRLLRGRALELLPPAGGYEVETRHLRRALAAGLTVGWVRVPAIYEGASSSFRPVRDAARVLWALAGPDASARPSPARSPRPAGFRPRRRTSSARPDTPVTAPRAQRA
jgi:MFS family permease